MPVRSIQVLLVGKDLRTNSPLVSRLRSLGCQCAVANSLQDAEMMLGTHDYDFVLSAFALTDNNSLSLLSLLEGRPVTLFFSFGVARGCWWLPALELGERRWGEPAMRPQEFLAYLKSLIRTAELSAAESPHARKPRKAVEMPRSKRAASA
jgi:DNA-binding response OmpR family regulator